MDKWMDGWMVEGSRHHNASVRTVCPRPFTSRCVRPRRHPKPHRWDHTSGTTPVGPQPWDATSTTPVGRNLDHWDATSTTRWDATDVGAPAARHPFLGYSTAQLPFLGYSTAQLGRGVAGFAKPYPKPRLRRLPRDPCYTKY
eukprot:362216-Chlamydomonas_euryale.AAC.3